MNSPSRPTRESTTRSSVWPQNGHFIGPPLVYRRASAGGVCLHRSPRAWGPQPPGGPAARLAAPRRPAARTTRSRVGSFWVERELVRQLLDLAAHRRLDRGRSRAGEHAVDEAGDLDHLALAHAP